MHRTTAATGQSHPGRVWFITGASRGLGHAFARAALEVGDCVVAVSRTPSALDELASDHPGRVLSLAVDVTDRAAVFAAVDRAIDTYGRLDVVVNNAGRLAMGMVEEFSEAQARAALETNFFGALWVSQAVLPQLRSQRSGHLIQVSSIGALGGFPSTGLYAAGKFALEGMSEAIAAELAPFDVKVTILQPGGYWTHLYTDLEQTDQLPVYDELRAELAAQFGESSVDSDPQLAAEALVRLVDSDDPPLRLLLGSMVYDLAFDLTRKRMTTWEGWEDVSRAAERPVPPPQWLLEEMGAVG